MMLVMEAPPINKDVCSNVATEIIFVDSRAENADHHVQSILATSTCKHVRIVYLLADANGVETISDTLSEQGRLEAAHIIASGSLGAVQLGNVYLCDANLSSHAGRIAAWKLALADDAAIVLHGCELEDTAGEHLMEDLGILTSARVVSRQLPA